jgi:hypothetical protein
MNDETLLLRKQTCDQGTQITSSSERNRRMQLKNNEKHISNFYQAGDRKYRIVPRTDFIFYFFYFIRLLLLLYYYYFSH